ncbi:hypothetical protein [uncultured Vibrio sp.]|uniref:hypothetical protein n=1 Tax=uncultured Vibrio sp. TaxID=114054 RepID=UPI0026186A6D|nr:hypothetical protein [uncultured Vibrio sp.]
MMEAFNVNVSNLIHAKLGKWNENVMLTLDEETSLHIPPEHQNKLSHYIDSDIIFGIRPEFVSIADNDEMFNVIDAQLVAFHDKNGSQYQEFSIGNNKVICRSEKNINEHSIGQLFKLNFDTYFGHIYDRETEENLTI